MMPPGSTASGSAPTPCRRPSIGLPMDGRERGPPGSFGSCSWPSSGVWSAILVVVQNGLQIRMANSLRVADSGSFSWREQLSGVATVLLLCLGLKIVASLVSSVVGWDASVGAILGSLLTLAAALALLRPTPEWHDRFASRWRSAGTGVVAFALATAACLGLSLWQVSIASAGVPVSWTPMLQHHQATAIVLYLLSYALVGPVGEELLFRGFLQGRMQAALGASAALLGTNLVFGLGHWSSLRSMIFAAAFGLVLGLYRYGGASLLECAAIHVVHNSLVYVDKYFFGVMVRT